MNVTFIPAYDRPEDVEPLLHEYSEMLIALEPDMAQCLANQNYDEELQHLRDKFGGAGGRMYLLEVDGAVAGCIALRGLTEGICELKRVYLRSAYRGQGLGDAMMEKMIADAREIGYRCMRLDTFPSLEAACHIYQKLGFYVIPPYYDTNPLENAIYLEKML